MEKLWKTVVLMILVILLSGVVISRADEDPVVSIQDNLQGVVIISITDGVLPGTETYRDLSAKRKIWLERNPGRMIISMTIIYDPPGDRNGQVIGLYIRYL